MVGLFESVMNITFAQKKKEIFAEDPPHPHETDALAV
jgi:hypothetical protein